MLIITVVLKSVFHLVGICKIYSFVIFNTCHKKFWRRIWTFQYIATSQTDIVYFLYLLFSKTAYWADRGNNRHKKQIINWDLKEPHWWAVKTSLCHKVGKWVKGNIITPVPLCTQQHPILLLSLWLCLGHNW